jgi:hypothetical protein
MRHEWKISRSLVIMGLAVCGLTRHALGGEPTDDRLGMRTVPIFLLARSDVQKDLGLTPKQGEECKHAAFTFYDRAFHIRGRKDAGAQAARKAIDFEMSAWLDKFLTPEQLDRLEQIDLQWEGASAMLSRPFLDDSLKLTPAQKDKVQACIAAGKAQRAVEGWSYENHVNQTRTAIAYLDARQRSLWIGLIGRPCPFRVSVEPQTAQSRPGQVK